MIVGVGALFFCSISLLNDLFKSQLEKKPVDTSGDPTKAQVQKIHMDIASNITHLPKTYIMKRGAIFFSWMLFFLLSMATIGLIPTVPIFVITFMRVEAREPWKIVLVYAAFMTVFIYCVFDQLLAIPWPQTVVGNMFPALKGLVPSM
jgi:Tripartite tricarboxylate transporter TctB family